MALNSEKKRALTEELAQRKYDDVSELNKIHMLDKTECVQQLKQEYLQRREMKKSEQGMKAIQVAEHRTRQYEQEEKLAMEMDKLKRNEIKEMKMRQMLRENCPELRELESKLRTAYVRKQLVAQMAEKESERLRNKIAEKESYQTLQTAWLKDAEVLRRTAEVDIVRKFQYKQELQDQIIFKEKRKRFLYEEFLQEKKIIDEIIQRIHDEDEREIEEKMCKMQKTKDEMDAFKAAQKIWRDRQRTEMELENKRIQEWSENKQAELEAKREEIRKREEIKEQFTERMCRKMAEEEAKRKEREDIMQELQEEKEKHAIEEKHRAKVEKELRLRIEMTQQLNRQIEERAMKLQREADEDARYKEELIAKAADDERLEQLSVQKRRLKMLQLRKDVEQMMNERREKRAIEMQVLQKMTEEDMLEKQERKRLIEEERMKMLKEHAKELFGYFPRGVLRPDDLAHLQDELRPAND